jgi:hypothetical protein
VVRAAIEAVPPPVAVARLKLPEAPSVTVKPLMMPLVKSAPAGTLISNWFVAVPNVCAPPATRLAVAPAVRPTIPAVTATVPLLPAVD